MKGKLRETGRKEQEELEFPMSSVSGCCLMTNVCKLQTNHFRQLSSVKFVLWLLQSKYYKDWHILILKNVSHVATRQLVS